MADPFNTEEPSRKPCPQCGKEVTWTMAGKPRSHKCAEAKKKMLWLFHPESDSFFSLFEEEYESSTDPDTAISIVLGECTDSANISEAAHLLAVLRKEAKPRKPVTVDVVVEAFITTRDLIEAKQKALDAELADLKALQQKRSDWIKTKLEELGCDNFKTAHGTAFITYKDSATVADGEVFKNWVHEDWEGRKFYLNNAVNKTAVKQALDDGLTVPPGVNYSRFKDVGIRRK